MRSEMSKFIILAAFAVGASLGLTAGIDTLKPARIRAKARLWTATLPDFYSREKYASAAEARAEARAAIPWFEAWEEPATPRCDDEEEALVNVAAVMGFSYAYEGFPTC